MTPHISAKKEEIAKVVLMPGDPLRAKWVAEKFLENPKLVNEVRGMLAYTGTYKGVRVTLMGSGMGMPSMGIYSHELMAFYDAEAVIRIGSCGGLLKEVEVRTLILATESWSDSVYAEDIGVEVPDSQILTPDPELVQIARDASKDMNLKVMEGKVSCEDAFYVTKRDLNTFGEETGTVAVEMEAFALYANAKKNNKKALAVMTCADCIPTGIHLPPKERQESFVEMVQWALEIARRFSEKHSLN